MALRSAVLCGEAARAGTASSDSASYKGFGSLRRIPGAVAPRDKKEEGRMAQGEHWRCPREDGFDSGVGVEVVPPGMPGPRPGSAATVGGLAVEARVSSRGPSALATGRLKRATFMKSVRSARPATKSRGVWTFCSGTWRRARFEHCSATSTCDKFPPVAGPLGLRRPLCDDPEGAATLFDATLIPPRSRRFLFSLHQGVRAR